mmetsp:Transcript_14588/g.49385  ORF Transcript_14588/g.49385 Transcript_14588/m.49385 type:complete len:451 (+) Transcript_14588:597-1949(+)
MRPLGHGAIEGGRDELRAVRVPRDGAHGGAVEGEAVEELPGVQVEDVHRAVLGPGVHHALPRGPRRAEVAVHKRLQHAVPSEGGDGGIVWVPRPGLARVLHPTVVPARKPRHRRQARVGLLGEHAPEVPELHGLVLAVGERVVAITLGGHVGEALEVPGKHAAGLGPRAVGRAPRGPGGRRGRPQGPQVPELEQAVVRGREEKVPGNVRSRHGIHVVAVGVHAVQHAGGLPVVHVEALVVGPGHEAPPAGAELHGPDPQHVVVAQGGCLVDLGHVALRAGGGVGAELHEVHIRRDGRVGEPPGVRAQRRVRDGPPEGGRGDLFDQGPALRVVHADGAVLEAAGEERAVLAVLTGVRPRLHGVHEPHAPVGPQRGDDLVAVACSHGRTPPAGAADGAAGEQAVQGAGQRARVHWLRRGLGSARLPLHLAGAIPGPSGDLRGFRAVPHLPSQ